MTQNCMLLLNMILINVTSSLNDDLEKIIVWSKKWAIDFNPFKTVKFDFSRKKLQFPELQFGIQGPKISQSLSHIHPGIHFQSDGHWNKHIHTIHDKAGKRLNLLRMLKYKINRKSLVITCIYNASWKSCQDNHRAKTQFLTI